MTSKEKILGVDFASLKTLQFVFELGSFSRAADKLGQTQSNVSYTIGRLRDSFSDPLFIREGTNMVSTLRCKAIVLETSKMLEDFQAIVAKADFSSDTANGLVTIACNHYERMIILPKLFNILYSGAPDIRVRVLNSHARGEEQLKRGECDVLIGPLQFVGDRIYKRRILNDRYVCIMDKHNPLARGKLTAVDIGSANHIEIHFSGGWSPPYLASLKALGVVNTPKLELSEYGDISGYVRGSNLIAFVPKLIAKGLDDELIKKKLPFDVPLEIDTFWTARTHQSPLHLWVRSAIASAARAMVS